jgi:hypothetical protein
MISHLLNLWRQRLAHASVVADDPHPASGSQWLWRMRGRILTFLISRYSEPEAARREEAYMHLVPDSLDSSLFEVQAQDAPPRSRRWLSPTLRSIHHENVEARRARRGRWIF